MRSLIALLTLLLLSPRPALAQSPRIGTLIVAHGGDSTWNAAVIAAARAVSLDGPVEVSFLMGPGAARARFQDAASRLADRAVDSIIVVPVLVSSHSGHYDQIRWLAGADIALDDAMQHHLHMSGIERPALAVPIRVAPAMDGAPELAEVVTDRGLALARTLAADPRSRALLIVGHGPNTAEENAAWMKDLRAVAEEVRRRTAFRDVRVGLMRDDAPAAVRAEAITHMRELIELQRAATGADVLVVPLLVAKGSVSRDKLPADLRGTPHVYSGEPLLPHAAMIRWIERSVRGH